MLKGDATTHEIFDHGLALERRAEADDRRTPLTFEATDLLARQIAMQTCGRSRIVGVASGSPRSLEFFWRLVAAVGEALVEQRVDGGLVGLRALALQVRAVRTAGAGRLVEVKSEPVQRALNLLDRTLGLALRIGVLDAQNRHATVVPGEQPVVERSAHASHVKEAGGRRGEADADSHVRKRTGVRDRHAAPAPAASLRMLPP